MDTPTLRTVLAEEVREGDTLWFGPDDQRLILEVKPKRPHATGDGPQITYRKPRAPRSTRHTFGTFAGSWFDIIDQRNS